MSSEDQNNEAIEPETQPEEQVEEHHRQPADLRGVVKSEAEFKNISRRSAIASVGVVAAAALGWRSLLNRPEVDNIPDILRGGFEFNESLWRGLARSGASAPSFDFDESSELRVNGRLGLDEEFDPNDWELQVIGTDDQTIGTHQIEDIRGLPQTEMIIEHYCVEGWSHIVTWGGVTFREFVETLYPEQIDAEFVALSTPDGEYQVGLDMESMLHHQTMLTLDLQREPLTSDHGAPVRLTTPTKYGIKQLKRIGSIRFANEQPEEDYWTERGYDWYAGL